MVDEVGDFSKERCRRDVESHGWYGWTGWVVRAPKYGPRVMRFLRHHQIWWGTSVFFKFSGTNSKCMKVGGTKDRCQRSTDFSLMEHWDLVKRGEKKRGSKVQPFDASEGKVKVQWTPVKASFKSVKVSYSNEFNGRDHPRICTCFHGLNWNWQFLVELPVDNCDLHSKLLVYQRVVDFNSIPIVESAERNQALRWIVKAGNAKILDSSMVEPGMLKRR